MKNRILAMLYRLLILFGVVCQLTGCGAIIVGGAAAVGTVAYVSGDLNTTLEVSFEQAVVATDAAIEENSIKQLTRNTDDSEAVYILQTVQEDRIEVKLTKATKNLTNITIRVGVFGDEALSNQVLDEIQERMPKT